MNIPQVQFNPRNITTQRKKPKVQSNDFKGHIKKIVDELDSKFLGTNDTSRICHEELQNKRRLYDVFNVFTAIGCMTRSASQCYYWNGTKQILFQLKTLKKQHRIDNWKLSLDELFPVNNCVYVTDLTIAFLLLFPAVDSNVIDVKTACAFFSRKTNRLKTTLSKLYQIILILSAINIVARTEGASQIRLLPPYLDCLIEQKKIKGPDSIEYLLNRRYDEKYEGVKIRRNELVNAYFLKEKSI